jgi:phosphoserine phosphatase RsbU/P
MKNEDNSPATDSLIATPRKSISALVLRGAKDVETAELLDTYQQRIRQLEAVVKQQHQRIAVLYDASQAVLGTFDLDEVVQQILVIARDCFHLHNVAVLLLDKGKQELYPRCVIGWDPGTEKTRLALEHGITGAAARQKHPIYAPDVSKDRLYVSTARSTRSELAIPLMVRDEVVGVLDCQSENPNHFDNDTIDLLTLFSTQASMALQNARLYSLEWQRARHLEVINAIAREITAVLDQEELFIKVCSVIQQTFQVGHVSMLLRDDEGFLVLRASQGRFTACTPAGGRLPVASGLWGRALAEGRTFIENDVRTIHEYIGFNRETQSRMWIPLVSFGQTLGVLMLENERVGSFQEGDVKSLEAVADICATAILNARYVGALKQRLDMR